MSSHIIEPFVIAWKAVRRLTGPAKHVWHGIDSVFKFNDSYRQVRSTSCWWTLPWSSYLPSPMALNSTPQGAFVPAAHTAPPVTFSFPLTPLVPKDKIHAAVAMMLMYRADGWPPQAEGGLAGTPTYVVDWLVAEALVAVKSRPNGFVVTKRGVRWVRNMLAVQLP